MKQKVYSIEQVTNKIKRYKRLAIGTLATSFLGAGLIIYSMYGINIKRPNIVNTFDNAKTTLNVLESRRKDLYAVPNFLYRNDEIDSLETFLLSKPIEKTKVENTINSLEKDIPQMENNQELIDYKTKVAGKNRKSDYGLGIILLSTFGSVGAMLKQGKWRREKEKIESAINY